MPTLSLIPAFFVIHAPAEAADTLAADLAIGFNADHSGLLPKAQLFLCVDSPTTELEDDAPIPESLEGLTIDSGSDRSATALLARIAQIGESVDRQSPEAVLAALSQILQRTGDWLRQRIATHPAVSLAPAPCAESGLSAAALLLHAYARAEATGTPHPHWSDLESARHAAEAEHPGLHAQLLDAYRVVLNRPNKD